MRPKDKVLAVYPHAYINGDGPRPNSWRVYASIKERAKEDPLILGRSGSPAGAWSNAARSVWVAGAPGVTTVVVPLQDTAEPQQPLGPKGPTVRVVRPDGVAPSPAPTRPAGVDTALNMMREARGGDEVKLWTPMCWDFARYVAQLEAHVSGVPASEPDLMELVTEYGVCRYTEGLHAMSRDPDQPVDPTISENARKAYEAVRAALGPHGVTAFGQQVQREGGTDA